jgi:hypothetical protein
MGNQRKGGGMQNVAIAASRYGQLRAGFSSLPWNEMAGSP